MFKKLIVCLIVAILLIPTTLVACVKSEPLKIVFIGDSISEGIIGPSPLSERERYAYYGVLGIRNGYIYKNRSVSGHQTKDMLDYIKQDDKDAKMVRTTIKEADIICASIIGNDLLQTSLGDTLLEFVNNDFSRINPIIETARENFAEIVRIIREYNPTATLFFQTVYNPAYPETLVIHQPVREQLATLGIYPDDYRDISSDVLALFNNVIKDYLIDHPDAFYVLDGVEAFEAIHQQDEERGRRLFSSDWVHPSSEGHAVLADYMQVKLEDLGLADKHKALQNYKELRIEQLGRLFSESVDVRAVKRQINKAKSCEEVTQIYFESIRGKAPSYYN
ncbi:MAG: GDSL-type esterase/lipase family protein [Clostridia bacterium]